MAIRRFDFTCTNGHTNEYWVNHDVTTTQCSECKAEAVRQISLPAFDLDPFSGDFYGASRQWEKRREQKLQQERRANSQ
jgi:hypothetical protein